VAGFLYAPVDRDKLGQFFRVKFGYTAAAFPVDGDTSVMRDVTDNVII
jgi:hypothetical protein